MAKKRLSYLVTHKRTGGYYARAYARGKEVWRSLKTKHFSVAEARLAEFLKEQREMHSAHANASSAKLTFGDAAELYRQRLVDNVEIKPRRCLPTGKVLIAAGFGASGFSDATTEVYIQCAGLGRRLPASRWPAMNTPQLCCRTVKCLSQADSPSTPHRSRALNSTTKSFGSVATESLNV